jgi:TonB-linked SusC/RagA family outer membrane protein
LNRSYQEVGAIRGTVQDAATAQPIAGAQVSIVGSQRGAVTNQAGAYLILNVPEGRHEIRVQIIGYTSQTQTVTVATEEVVTADFSIRQTVLDLQEIVVTGVSEGTTRAKLPFTVARLTTEDLPVPSPSAAGLLQGKVAGATVMTGNARPGNAPSILLRAPTSIDATGRSQEPLYIVDGTILASSAVDLDALDIASIEVVKGAAAASLYGSRAGNGVIQITTVRGQGGESDRVRYTLRSEVGESSIHNNFKQAQYHVYRMTPDGGRFIDAATGEPCIFRECQGLILAGQRAGAGAGATAWNTFQEQVYPQVFDNIGVVFNSGLFTQQQLAVDARSGSTNFYLSYSYLRDEGIVYAQDGFRRHNFRINLDQSVRDDLSLSASASLSKSRQDLQAAGSGVFYRAVFQPVGGDITERDENGDLLLTVDPILKDDNPLIELLHRDWFEDRTRLLASAQLRYQPFSWGLIEGSASLDRLDRHEQDFRDRGYPTDRPEPVNDGHLALTDGLREAVNANIDLVLRREWGDLAGRLRGRWLVEDDHLQSTAVSGFDLAAQGVPSVENLQDPSRIDHEQIDQRVRSEGWFLTSGLDLKDRYIVDALVRRDGSSLFGADERWRTYFRLAGAWRITEEPWFNIDWLNELKLRYSYGQAGGRPNFFAQYETFQVGAGVVRPITLGNRKLRPEFITEHEMGVDLLAFDRVSLSLVHARGKADDQILPVPLPAATGFTTQWQNVGTLESKSYEATLEVDLIRSENFTWSHNLTFDRTTSVITELAEGIQPFRTGVPGQGLGDLFFIREGETMGTLFGTRFAKRCGDLPAEVQPMCGSHFDVNDDGLLVYVGQGNTWRSMRWGETGEVGGQTYQWGAPIARITARDPLTGEETTFLPNGKTIPDFTVNWTSSANWRGFGLYTLFSWVQGFDILNSTVRWSVQEAQSSFGDQAGKPEEEKKPLGYYQAIYNGAGGADNYWTEDGSYLKLREVSLRYRYRPTSGFLSAFDAVSVGVTGRNLLTFTGYRGYDPDVGVEGGALGSAVLGRVDGHPYPNFRTWTLAVDLTF